jgi:hypothetical protein
MSFTNFLAGIIAGFISLIVNALAQFLIQGTVNWLTAIATAIGMFIVFTLIASRYKGK